MSLLIGVDAREWIQDRQTGIGRYLEGVIQRALAIRPGWKWVLFQHRSDARRIKAESVSYRDLDRGPSVYIDQVVLPKYLKRERPDLFFSPYPKSPWRARCPVVVVVHDLHPLSLEPAQGGLSGLRRHGFSWYIRNSVRRAARVVTVSQASARDIHRHLGLPVERIDVIYQAVDLIFSREPSERNSVVCKGYGLAGPYFLSVGNLKPHKNLATLIRAWSRFEPAYFSAVLALAGSGPNESDLKLLARTLGIHKQIRWLGHVPDTDLPALYRNAVALLQPSIIEGFGLPVAEAMACGTPAIVSDGGSLPEIVGDVMPILSPLNEEGWASILERLLLEPVYREQLARAAHERANAFRLEETTDRMLALLERAARPR